MTHVVLAGAFAGLIALGGPSSDATPRSPAPHEQGASIAGCLLSGSASGEFLVSTGTERHTVVAGQGVDLAAHVNHRVELTGELERGTSGQVFRATGVKMLATSCTAS